MKRIKYLIICLALFIPQIVLAEPNATINTNLNSNNNVINNQSSNINTVLTDNNQNNTINRM